MFFKKKCQRCGRENLREFIVTIQKFIQPYNTNKSQIKINGEKEKCWICDDCDAVNYYMGDMDGDWLTYSNSKEYERITKETYSRDEGFEIKLLYKEK